MVNKLFNQGKKMLTDPQNSVLSAATVIMFMVVASRVLGLVRQRTLAHFFTPEELSLFFAAFRLPDTIFEVLVFGTFCWFLLYILLSFPLGSICDCICISSKHPSLIAYSTM